MAVLISGCSPSDERPQADLHEALTVKMDVDGQDVYDVSALRFESGVLREVLPLEKSHGDNIYILEPSEISGRLYLLANSSALAARKSFNSAIRRFMAGMNSMRPSGMSTVPKLLPSAARSATAWAI